MSDTWIVIIGTVVLFVLFVAVRYFRAGKKHDDVVSEAWRREQAKRDEADDDTKTWPLPPAAV